MNPVVFIHLLAALFVIVTAVPLMRGKVKMNYWYGVRIPAAFASEERWYAINRYGGRLLLYWGLAIGATAAIGALLEREYWIAYNWTSLGIVMVGLAWVVIQIQRYARK